MGISAYCDLLNPPQQLATFSPVVRGRQKSSPFCSALSLTLQFQVSFLMFPVLMLGIEAAFCMQSTCFDTPFKMIHL